ncbi:hypothetical protein D1157_16655 [Anaerotruncus sp. X29]|nr:hypothetical protein [Anaerotruncus sp. X29]RKJ81736.1 hypothetical protein D7Y41_25145 [Anaerotruncus sp. 1XD22-93]
MAADPGHRRQRQRFAGDGQCGVPAPDRAQKGGCVRLLLCRLHQLDRPAHPPFPQYGDLRAQRPEG